MQHYGKNWGIKNVLLDRHASVSALGSAVSLKNPNYIFRCLRSSVKTACCQSQKILGWIETPIQFNKKARNIRMVYRLR